MKHFIAAISLASLPLFIPSIMAEEDAQTAKDRTIVEVILRRENFDFANASPKVKEAIARYLAANAGTEEFFTLIERFQIKDQGSALLKLAKEHGGDNIGAHAARLLLEAGLPDAAKTLIKEGDEKAAANLLASIGAAGGKAALSMLQPLVADSSVPASRRKAALEALAKSGPGQSAILDLAKADKLSPELKQAASTALQLSSDPKIRDEAATVLKAPVAAKLPPVGELVKRSGDPKKGESVFLRTCIGCHKVGELGIDFGPALGEIGGKLPKDALYTSILEPSAAISFGFEGYEIKMKSGAMQIGIIASQTETDLTLKAPGGVLVPLKKSDIATTTKMALSLMPAGLQTTMSEQDLVDLVEYLSSLKKK